MVFLHEIVFILKASVFGKYLFQALSLHNVFFFKHVFYLQFSIDYNFVMFHRFVFILFFYIQANFISCVAFVRIVNDCHMNMDIEDDFVMATWFFVFVILLMQAMRFQSMFIFKKRFCSKFSDCNQTTHVVMMMCL